MTEITTASDACALPEHEGSTRKLAITGDRNRPGRRDFSGAFEPESIRYVIDSGTVDSKVRRVPLDAPKEAQRDAIDRAIREVRPVELGVLCHGYARRIEIGYDVATVDRLAAVLAEVGCARVALHACSTGSHATAGFAARLRDAMCAAGLDARVLGSVTAGHASRNPNRRLFVAPAGSAGEYIVAPGSDGWRAWCRRMRDGDDALRWQLLRRA